MRPLFVEFPGDPATWDQDDQFMFGGDLLVAPVLRPAERERSVYLPKGTWYDFWTGAAHEGGRRVTVPVTLSSIPIFVRPGAFIYQQPVVQHTGEMKGQPLRVSVHPAVSSASTLYEDDGETLQYRTGAFAKRRFAQTRVAGGAGQDQTATIEIGAAEGSYRPAPRPLVLDVGWSGAVRRVSTRGASGAPVALERVEPPALEARDAGWALAANGRVLVRIPDRFDGVVVTIER
jgi:hypothetical protein